MQELLILICMLQIFLWILDSNIIFISSYVWRADRVVDNAITIFIYKKLFISIKCICNFKLCEYNLKRQCLNTGISSFVRKRKKKKIEKKYWFDMSLLKTLIGGKVFNFWPAMFNIVYAYIISNSYLLKKKAKPILWKMYLLP